MTGNRKYTVSLLICLVTFLSCQREDVCLDRNGDSQINLAAAVPGTSTTLTKASGQTDYKGVINSTTDIDDGLVVGMLRVDQTRFAYEADGGGLAALDFKNVNIVDASFNPKDYTFDNAHPYYYCSQANLAGNPGVRYVDFDILQYYKNEEDVVHYYGWYPYGTPVTSASEAFKVNFTLDGKTDVLYSGAATQIQNKQSDTLRLHHTLCQYRIWIYRMTEVGEEGTHKAGRWGKVTSIVSERQNDRATFTLPSTITYGASASPAPNFNLSSLPNATIVDGLVTGAVNGLFYATQERRNGVLSSGITIPLGIDSTQQIACYLAPPPTDNHLFLQIHTDATEGSESTNTKDLSVAGNFQAGSAYDIILCFSDHGVINAAVKTSEWAYFGTEVDVDVEAKMYYDLSRYGTANCYVVSSANVGYSFQGNVKGCGNSEGGGSLVGVDDCSLPANCHVDIIYQSVPDLIHLDAQSLIDGKVLFWVPGDPLDESSLALINKGNAIIAARREKNGEILWSWHIWVTDRPQNQGYLNGYDVMDRNLGALSGPRTVNQIKTADATSYGFYYQWGRKDPMIPGVTTWSTTGLADEAACIAAGIKSPMVMYSNWNVDDIETILGYRNAQENVKTIYDPCPPGYRAPESEAFKTLSALKVDISGMTGVKGGTFTGDQYNYFFYPDAGFISAKAGMFTAGATIASTGANDAYGEIFEYTTAPEDFLDGDSGEIVKIADLPSGSQPSGIDYLANQQASAFSMRCISQGSKTRVVNLCEAQTANCYIVPNFGAYKFRVDIKGNGVNRVNIGGSMWNIDENAGVDISLSSINHVAVLWWQGDISGDSDNNTKGTDCPIKFVNDGRSLPRTPAHNTSDFGEDDITVPDEDGYVQFYVEENNWGRGNAVIAAFDAGNNVLWSWHIWITEDPGIINMGPWYSSEDSYTYEYSMMDRNLGATYHPTASEFSARALNGDADAKTLASVGMYYQWGRKDPIQGASTFAATYTSGSSSTASKNWYKRNTSGNYAWETKTSIEVAEAVESMTGSEKNPSTFYKNTTWNTKILGFEIQPDRALFEKNWYAYKFGCDDSIIKKIFAGQSVKVDDWEINKFIGRWGFNTPSQSSMKIIDPSMTKTMYDPCPPGYYMPSSGLLTAAAVTTSAYGSDDTNKYSSSSFVWSVENSWTAGSETHGVFINSGTFVCDDDIWIPFGGYRDFESGKFNTTHIASGTPSAVWAIGQDFNSNLYEYYAGVRSYVVTGTGSGQMRGIRPADGVNVRCRAY